jgi:ABC-2 type transport system permease protein
MYINKNNNQNKSDLLRELVKSRFKLRYNNSVMGFMWVLMKPLLSFLILYFIFTAFRGGGHDRNYAVELLLGIGIYTFINEGTIFGMNSLLDVANIILKINFPRYLAITSALMMALINFSINFVIVIFFAIVVGDVNTSLLALIYLLGIFVLTYLIINVGAFFLSIIMVRVRDLTNIMELTFQLLFWGSAVFFRYDDLQGRVGDVIRLNPIAIIIDAARKALVHGEIAHFEKIIIITVITIIGYVVGKFYFNSKVTKIAEYF